MILSPPAPDPGPGAHGKVRVTGYVIVVPARDQFWQLIPGYAFRCTYYSHRHRKCVLFKTRRRP